MLSLKKTYVLAGLMITTVFCTVHCNIHDVLRVMISNEDMQEEMISLQSGTHSWDEGLPRFVDHIRNIKKYAQQLNMDQVPIYDSVFYALQEALRSKIPDPEASGTPPKELYPCSTLRHLDWVRRDVGYPFATGTIAYEKRDGHCYSVKLYEEVYADTYGFNVTIKNICNNLDTCSREPNPYEGSADPDVTTVCTADHKCNVNKALPMMAGTFYTKVYELVANYECCDKINYKTSCKNYQKSFDEMMYEADLLLAYVYSQADFGPAVWKRFFTNAISINAHVDIEAALSTMLENKKDFESARIACRVLKDSNSCNYDDIYKQYEIIEKNRQNRNNPGYVKDLRLNAQMDHTKMIELQNIKITQIELLGSIDKLDENLEASVDGISTFFRDLAKFDKGIADADEQFINAELEKYTEALIEVERKLTADIQEAMTYMATVKTANLAEEIALLAIQIAENCNPLKLVFSGPDIADVVEQASEIADAAAELGWAISLVASLRDVALDSFELFQAFLGNSGQLTTLESVKNQIMNGNADNLNEDADRFLEEYAAYTPQTDRSRIARNNALWSAYKDSTCDLLTDDAGLAGTIAKGIATGQLLCERLEGTLAQFFTLREDIFDFQFQLVDAIAGVVRGNIAYRLAENIKGEENSVNGAELVISSFMTQQNLQTVASLMCDKIEYKQLGQRYTPGCATFNGLFTKENLDALVAYTDSTTVHHEIKRYITIPTQSSYPGDASYVDLNSLANGNEVVFKVPKNKTWLTDHRWLIPGQSETQVPFVKSFQIYLPHKSYKSGSIPSRSTMEVTIKSIAGSSISLQNPNTGSVYLLPRGSGTYLTTYEENYSNCPNEIPNPYSLCSNLPDLCLLSSRHPGPDALMPSVLSTWSIQLSRTQGAQKLSWDPPHPATKFSLSAKVVLRAPSNKRKRSHLSKLAVRSDVVDSVNGCCEGNRYKMPITDKCKNCPTNSTAVLRGLYCHIDLPAKSD